MPTPEEVKRARRRLHVDRALHWGLYVVAGGSLALIAVGIGFIINCMLAGR